jgi:hypothetical protein
MRVRGGHLKVGPHGRQRHWHTLELFQSGPFDRADVQEGILKTARKSA